MTTIWQCGHVEREHPKANICKRGFGAEVHNHDLICARFGTRNIGYVTDDNGGLFEIDMVGKSCREVARDSASYICSLDFREVR
jgi:hypothetical protein